jgi:NAD(P)H dehydrogenase (quinone)
MTKIGVIGATGHLGGKVVDYLLAEGVNAKDIVAFYRDEKKTANLKGQGVELRFGDYSENGYEKDTLAGIDRLLFVSSSNMDSFGRIVDHIGVVKAAREAGVKHIYYTSLAYPESALFDLKDVHIATESAIRVSGIPYTFLRNTFYLEVLLGENDVKRAFDSGKMLSLAKGRGLNLVLREDMAHATAVALTTDGHENKTYTFARPDTFTVKDVVDVINELSGKSIEFVESTPEAVKAYLTELGVPEEYQMWDSINLQFGYAEGWAGNVSSDLVDLIGKENLTSLKEYVSELL